ncbi:putative carboxylesterase 15 [Dichanthelium oligosanthes]|uniref:Putative carboxylesterase 15 n=1 Tax=Dichanthelium oligosanthes TaxID=888268 RepID=A0A1E5V192_9POAL|nr:putative carboxylesterase 15 [Dichanthelium oligosanthes]
MSPPSSEPHVVEDIRGLVQLMSDGTVLRSADPASFPVVDADPDDGDDDSGVEWKDVTWEREHDLNARLYRPCHLGAANDAQIPVVAYFHGGGAGGGFFCLGSGRWPGPHAWCLRLAAELPAVVLSFDYRLAPEHRLPAAQEDGAAAMTWLRAHAAHDPWLADAADFARVFVSGASAGGNVAHHVAARFGKAGLGAPIRIRGSVLLTPAMAGEARTRAEAARSSDANDAALLTADMIDRYARLFLPTGATRDHPAINLSGPVAPALGAVAMAPLLVVAADRDVLRDRHAQYARRMKEEWGKDVEYAELAGVGHGFSEADDPWSQPADELVRLVRRFVVAHMDAE